MIDRKRTEPLRQGVYYGWELRRVLEPQPKRATLSLLWAFVCLIIAAVALGFLVAL